MPDFATSIDIEAPIDVVFEHLVKPDRMTRWMGSRATLHPVPGGEFSVDINGYLVRGEYVEVEPPHRVVVSWGMEGVEDLPPGSSRVEFTLTPTRNGTTVSLRHTALPESHSRGHATGWSNYLGRLAVAAGGSDPGPDDWRPGGN
ncbi:MAG TPA: SRPBCC domain-containing protein [Candidatus Dormibacteraeota bacterium]|nr:SRPBCC domain-containing protein [Candidatus Dormibacteraeota bacterium]